MTNRELVCKLAGFYCPTANVGAGGGAVARPDIAKSAVAKLVDKAVDKAREVSNSAVDKAVDKAREVSEKLVNKTLDELEKLPLSVPMKVHRVGETINWEEDATDLQRLAGDVSRTTYEPDEYHAALSKEARSLTEENTPDLRTMAESIKNGDSLSDFVKAHNIEDGDARMYTLVKRWRLSGGKLGPMEVHRFRGGVFNRTPVDEGIMERELQEMMENPKETMPINYEETAEETATRKAMEDARRKVSGNKYKSDLSLVKSEKAALVETPKSKVRTGKEIMRAVATPPPSSSHHRSRSDNFALELARLDREMADNKRISNRRAQANWANQVEAERDGLRLGLDELRERRGRRYASHVLESVEKTDHLHSWFFEPDLSSEHIKTYSHPDGRLVVGFKGTEGWFDGMHPSNDFIQNLSNAAGYEHVANRVMKHSGINIHTKQSRESQKIIEKIKEDNRPVYLVTGHSKGGAMATINRKALNAENLVVFNEAPTVLYDQKKPGESLNIEWDLLSPLAKLRNNPVRVVNSSSRHSMSQYEQRNKVNPLDDVREFERVSDLLDDTNSDAEEARRLGNNKLFKQLSDKAIGLVNDKERLLNKMMGSEGQGSSTDPLPSTPPPKNRKAAVDATPPPKSRIVKQAPYVGYTAIVSKADTADVEPNETSQLIVGEEAPTAPKPLVGSKLGMVGSLLSNVAGAELSTKILPQASNPLDRAFEAGASGGAAGGLFSKLVLKAPTLFAVSEVPGAAAGAVAAEAADEGLEALGVENREVRGTVSGGFGGFVGSSAAYGSALLGSAVTGAEIGGVAGIPGIIAGTLIGAAFGGGLAAYQDLYGGDSSSKDDDKPQTG